MNNDSYGTTVIPIIRTREEFDGLKRQAIDGEPKLQCAVADICSDDSRTEFYNLSEAAYWYEKAAALGHTRAQWLLGVCYLEGIGVDQNSEQAEFWLLKSADSGNADGQFTLGGYYFMKPDIVKTEYWVKKAASQGHEDAIKMLTAIKHLLKI